jgi:hypothetical protein
MLFQVKALYRDWQNDKSILKDLQEGLKAVLRFPRGWMKNSEGVDEAVGKHCIPLIARQLYDLFMDERNYDGALGISAMICDSGKLLDTYSDWTELKLFMVELMKPVAIKSLQNRQTPISF